MFSRLFKNLRKVFLGIIFFLFIVATIALSVSLFINLRELDDVRDKYENTQEGLTQNEEENNDKVSELEEKVEDLEDENNELKEENESMKTDLEAFKQEGLGEIRGEVVPVLLRDINPSRYQLVCAISVANNSIKYCQTISTIKKDYKLMVPEGDYIVSSQLIDADTNELIPNMKAFYTEFINCINNNPTNECDESKSQNNYVVKAKAGQIVQDANPIDWNL